MALYVGEQTAAGRGLSEVLDTLGVPTRNAQRRGSGWLAGQADSCCRRLGWDEGSHLRLAATVALHNCCIWLNEHLGRPPLAFADLVEEE